jgi:glutathione peroxidase
LFSKIEVNGDGACDLYKYLKAGKADDDGNADVAWNFTKFLVNGSGEVVGRYAPQATPEDIAKDLPALL